MINSVNEEIHRDDNGIVTSIELKLKSFEQNDDKLADHSLVGTITCALITKTTLFENEEIRGYRADPEIDRPNVVNVIIKLGDNHLTRNDVANFIDSFIRAINETKLF